MKMPQMSQLVKNLPNKELLELKKAQERYEYRNIPSVNTLKNELERRRKLNLIRKDAGLKKTIKNKLGIPTEADMRRMLGI